ncbi:unnamed protein product [Owenia fusiformis]|uniref:NADH dehydrogenase [ubiquinone] 1 alpha subcomplex assembly factor 3 n=1 Tax=Owenia fusiformis TaxID=6347 RepID=A0A8J1XZ29_OWEFU|nr:unnamed protein product [Owenia fusiformis]
MTSILLRQCRMLSRTFRPNQASFSARQHSYDQSHESDKTTVRIMNMEQDLGIMVDTFSPHGFRLNNGFQIIGPCALFPRSVLHWNVEGCHDINEESLSLFTLLEPKIDILVLGIGDRANKIDTSIIKFLRSKKISVEILPTETACSTFNFLNAEKRYCAAGLIPPSGEELEYEEDMVLQQLARQKDIYTMVDSDIPEDPEMVKEMLQKGPEKLMNKLAGRESNTLPDFNDPKYRSQIKKDK